VDRKESGGREPHDERSERADDLGARFDRRKFIVGAGAGAFALAGSRLTGNAFGATASPEATPPPLKRGLAPGKYGGPTGFPGAQRYQYEFNSAEGRAIAGLRKLVKDGRAPKEVTIQISPGALGHWTTPYPTKSAPTPAQILEQETGIKLKFIQIQNTQLYQKNIQEAQLRTGKWQIGELFYSMKGDLAEAGLCRNLDEFVAKYKPDWGDPRYGYAGGPTTAHLFNYYKGSAYIVAFDGDFMPWFYRSDLFNNPKERTNFEDRYGRPLTFPKTWQEQAQVAAFFTRPSQNMYGAVDMKNPGWGYPTWEARYASFGNPNRYYFGTDGSALINSAAGVQALEEHVKSMEWTYPGALSKSWPEMYAAMGNGTGVMCAAFGNMTKFITAGNPLDKGFGKFLRSSIAPGRVRGSVLISRNALFANTSYLVNAFSNKKYHEAYYLILQWAGAARVFTWMVGNPAGYYDPNRTWTLNDPIVRASYKPYAASEMKLVIPHSVPDITLRGANEYLTALDTNIQKALTKQITAKQAMKNAADQWDRITKRLGTKRQAAAMNADRLAWGKATNRA
jgi:multiple sugar transport system substrate-binding protein